MEQIELNDPVSLRKKDLIPAVGLYNFASRISENLGASYDACEGSFTPILSRTVALSAYNTILLVGSVVGILKGLEVIVN